jgi:hypothetical protein
MARYPLRHRHQPDECGVVFASFKGHHSPLVRRAASFTAAMPVAGPIWAGGEVC